MGRGPRSNQAVNIAATPRLLRRPKVAGQKRYLVYRKDPRYDLHREPGYIVSAAQGIIHPFENEMLVKGEIAVEGGDGNLHWVEKDVRAYIAGTDEFRIPLHDARRAASCLNKFPLGPVVGKEVDGDSNLVIGYGNRQIALSKEGREPGSDYTRIIYKEQQSFDVTDPIQAQQAAELFEQFEERKIADELAEGQGALTKLARSEKREDRERAKAISRPALNKEKIAAAERFAEALEDGDFKEIDAEIIEKQEIEDAAESKRVASRMQKTLRSLGQG